VFGHGLMQSGRLLPDGVFQTSYDIKRQLKMETLLVETIRLDLSRHAS
jgi:hypothetical protein